MGTGPWAGKGNRRDRRVEGMVVASHRKDAVVGMDGKKRKEFENVVKGERIAGREWGKGRKRASLGWKHSG